MVFSFTIVDACMHFCIYISVQQASVHCPCRMCICCFPLKPLHVGNHPTSQPMHDCTTTQEGYVSAQCYPTPANLATPALSSPTRVRQTPCGRPTQTLRHVLVSMQALLKLYCPVSKCVLVMVMVLLKYYQNMF
jgi:hypothetical protein